MIQIGARRRWTPKEKRRIVAAPRQACALYVPCVMLPNYTQIVKLRHLLGQRAMISATPMEIPPMYWRPGALWGGILGLLFRLWMLVSR